MRLRSTSGISSDQDSLDCPAPTGSFEVEDGREWWWEGWKASLGAMGEPL